MLKIKTFAVNPIGENTYVVSDDTREAVLIDCGMFSTEEKNRLAEYVEQEQLAIRHILCTHGHFDHLFGCPFVAERYGVLPELHPDDWPLYDRMAEQVRDFIGISYTVKMPSVGTCLHEGDVISFGNHKLTVLHTPGHSPGGVVYYCAEEEVLFSGDSLFRFSIGRTDLPGGDHRTLVEGLTSKVLTLPESTTVYPGHGPVTTVGDERRANPYLI